MDGAILKIDTVTIYGYSLVLALSFLWGSFVAYKKATEAHFDDLEILDAVVLSGFWAFVLGRLTFALLNWGTFWGNWQRLLFLKNYPGLDHWGLLLGIVVGIYIITRKSKQKFFDWFDYAMLGLVGGMGVYFAGLSFKGLSLITIGGALVSLGMFAFLWKAEKEYRTYDWYKNKKTQSKSGFIAGVALSFYGLTHVVLWFFTAGRANWTILVNIALFVGGWVLVYSRSGRSLKDDLKFMKIYGRKKE